MELDVFVYKRRDEVVAVVVALLEAQRHSLARRRSGLCKRLQIKTNNYSEAFIVIDKRTSGSNCPFL